MDTFLPQRRLLMSLALVLGFSVGAGAATLPAGLSDLRHASVPQLRALRAPAANSAAGALLQADCVTQTSGDGWLDEPFDIAQNGTFTARFDATPSVSPITGSGHVGLSLGVQNAYTGFANIVRFNTSGNIDARNGGAYAAAATIPYSAGITYHFRLVVNVTAHTYSIFVAPGSGAELTVGSNFAFRTEQNTVNGLDWYGVFIPDGSTDSLTVCNFTVTPAAPPPCVTATGGAGFQNRSFPTQTTTFTAEFDATPSISGINSIVGLSSGSQTDFTGYAAIPRFNPAGIVDARNGGAYQSDVAFPFTGGSTYHFRLFVDIPNHVYSVSVTPPGGSETLLTTTPYAFRTEQAGVANLNNWAVQVNATPGGSNTVCGFIIRPGGLLPALR
jgi:hypothetical protein